MKKLLSLLLVVLLSSASLTSCSFFNKKYDIIFELNGGSMSEEIVQEAEENKIFYLPTPVKSGYRFVGWYLSPDFSGNPITVYNPEKNTTFYAKYELVYTITYISQGGEHSNPTEISESETIILSDVVKAGEFFAGWYTDVSGMNRVHTLSNVKSNLILYAKYYPKFSIYYNLNNGINDVNNPNAYCSELGANLFNPTKPGYTFAGWETSDGNKIQSFIPVGTSGDISLKATWTPATYSIYWETKGATLNNAPTAYTYLVGVASRDFPTPENTNKIFLYWYRIVNGVETPITSISSTDYGNITIYAKYYDTIHTVNSLWSAGIEDTKYKDSSISKVGDAYQIKVPERLIEYAKKGILHVKITANFTTQVRSAGNATATASTYLIVDGEQKLVSEISVIGGGYNEFNVLGTFPRKGEWATVKESQSFTAKFDNENDVIKVDALYKMKSDRKSETVTTDLSYICNSLSYEFYID